MYLLVYAYSTLFIYIFNIIENLQKLFLVTTKIYYKFTDGIVVSVYMAQIDFVRFFSKLFCGLSSKVNSQAWTNRIELSDVPSIKVLLWLINCSYIQFIWP